MNFRHVKRSKGRNRPRKMLPGVLLLSLIILGTVPSSAAILGKVRRDNDAVNTFSGISRDFQDKKDFLWTPNKESQDETAISGDQYEQYQILGGPISDETFDGIPDPLQYGSVNLDKAIDFLDVEGINRPGEGITIAVVDTGLYPNEYLMYEPHDPIRTVEECQTQCTLRHLHMQMRTMCIWIAVKEIGQDLRGFLGVTKVRT